MNSSEIVNELSKSIPQSLAFDLVKEFLELRQDVQTETLSRASGGKFIETVVQILELLETGRFSTHPSVDAYLKGLESRSTSLNDDLRITLSRIARATYTLRNKRNILHKGQIDTNVYDLKFTYSCCQWILTELIRQLVVTDIHTAGEIVEYIQLPVSSIIESIDGRKIVHAKLTVKQEILIVLYSFYPNRVSQTEIKKSLDRRAESSVYKVIKALWNDKLVHNNRNELILTQTGFLVAQKILKEAR